MVSAAIAQNGYFGNFIGYQIANIKSGATFFFGEGENTNNKIDLGWPGGLVLFVLNLFIIAVSAEYSLQKALFLPYCENCSAYPEVDVCPIMTTQRAVASIDKSLREYDGNEKALIKGILNNLPKIDDQKHYGELSRKSCRGCGKVYLSGKNIDIIGRDELKMSVFHEVAIDRDSYGTMTCDL